MTIVETRYGRIEGAHHHGVQRFLGVPYAAPPVGELRFRHPVIHAGWAGVREAKVHAPASLQAGPADKPVRGSEDCLYLDIYTPSADLGLRPTMVWFHGGGFTTGAGWLPESDGSRLALAGDVVVVNCNYRLGALGWLYPGELGDDRADANCGLFDQLAALRWVQDNIEQFGGDPNNVTAFGQSAGAVGIVTLAVMPESRGLLHRVIAQSRVADAVLTPSEAGRVTSYMLDTLTAPTIDALLAADPRQILHSQDQALFRAAWAENAEPRAPRLLHFGPVVDGATVSRAPLDCVHAGDAADIALIAGSNHDEWRYFLEMAKSSPTEEEMIASLRAWVPDADTLWKTYRVGASTARDAWIDLQTDRHFRIPAIRLSEAWGAHQPSTFDYELRWWPPGSDTGATHGREIPFLFDSFHHPRGRFRGGASPPRSLIDGMQRAWTTFARIGRPTLADHAVWLEYGNDRSTMVFDADSRMENDPYSERRRAWDQLGS